MNSLEKAIWNWMEHYPSEFADLQVGFTVYLRHTLGPKKFTTIVFLRRGLVMNLPNVVNRSLNC